MEGVNLFKEIINGASLIAVVPADDFQGDSFAAALGLVSALKDAGKKTMMPETTSPKRLDFLKNLDKKIDEESVISIDAPGRDITHLRYEKQGSKLKICLAVKNGALNDSDIALSSSRPHDSFLITENDSPDLIIALGTQSHAYLNRIFSKNQGVFDRSTVIQINNGPDNLNQAKAKITDRSRASLSEIAAELILNIAPEVIGERSATFFLAGLIYATQNFQNPKSDERTLALAGNLIAAGADHQLIVRHLYKTKSLPELKLLGRALERLNVSETNGLVSASLTLEDFQQTKASSKDLSFVLGELKAGFWQMPSIMLLWESHGSGPLIKGIFTSKNSQLLERILKKFDGVSRNETALFIIRELELDSAQKKILEII